MFLAGIVQAPAAMGFWSLQLGGRYIGLWLSPSCQAPLHAPTLGFFASMLLGMAARVTMGQSGRPLTADFEMRWAFWLMQAVASLRVLGEFSTPSYIVTWISAVLWLVAFALWAWRYAPALWHPRQDRKPGKSSCTSS